MLSMLRPSQSWNFSSAGTRLTTPRCPTVLRAPLHDSSPFPDTNTWSKVLILICSSRPPLRAHFRRHQSSTLEKYNIEVKFFVEQRSPELEEEANLKGDMVFLNETNRTQLAALRKRLGQEMTDSFNSPEENMLRDYESFQWALRNRRSTTWFVHSDEDQFWCAKKLRWELTRQEMLFTAKQPCVHIGNYISWSSGHVASDVATAMNMCAVQRFVEKATRLISEGKYAADAAGRAYRDWVDEYDEVRVLDDKQFVAYGDWRDPSMWTYPEPKTALQFVDNRTFNESILFEDWKHGWVPYRNLVEGWKHFKSCICSSFMSIHINDKSLSDLSELAILSNEVVRVSM